MLGAIVIGAWVLGSASGPTPTPVSCQWDPSTEAVQTSEGYEVKIILVHMDGPPVELVVDQQALPVRVLTTPDPSTGYSGSAQCRLAGRHWFTVTFGDRKAGVYLDVDEPTNITVGPQEGGLGFAIWAADKDPGLD
ncbi:MAG: hypothetical protein EON90_09110 [Brevundimonas sp.]|nr:MAG: hypothetical protein EON90_09110 [Brevundimonas sp.]